MLAVVSKVLSLITDLHGDSTDSYSSESETESSASDDTDIASAIGTAASAAKRRNGRKFPKRSSPTAGWRAEVVTLITSADWEDEEGGITDPTVGTVTDVTENAVVIDYLHTVNMDGAVHHGYRPWKGDWVKAETSENGTVHLEPLRSQILTGKVSQVRGDTGVVDSEVVFWPQVCVDGYVPSRGDWVEVTAIESSQGHYNWRATSVTPVRRPTRDRGPSKLKSWQTQKVQDGWVIPGQSPFRRKPVRFPVHLPHYPVPDMLRNCVFAGGDVNKIMPVLSKVSLKLL
ncbi:hypothetical protein Bbelb_186410 [Branchiostoma belcheri]|nr:hypothetical protein Bbelb_186410 [Branchiostoma belcheri]